MLKLFEKLVEISRINNIKILIYFEKCKGILLISREIKALDEFGRITPWSRAFAGISLQNILDQCRIKKIEVYRENMFILETKSLNEIINKFK